MKDVLIDFSDAVQRSQFLAAVRSLKNRQRVSIVAFRERRSLQQNAYYWGVILPHVAAGIEESWGEQFTSDDAHEYLKGRFLVRPVINRVTGEHMGVVVDSSAMLDTAKFSLYIENIRKFAAESLGVEIPEASIVHSERLSTEIACHSLGTSCGGRSGD